MEDYRKIESVGHSMKKWIALRKILFLMILSCSAIIIKTADSQIFPDFVIRKVLAEKDHPPLFQVELIAIYPHDRKAFTQGLLYRDGFIFESTGHQGASSLRKVAIKTGEVITSVHLAHSFFAEGLAFWKGNFVQLTYKAGKAFIYEGTSMEKLREFTFQGEGWGLTNNEHFFIMSNGSPKLYFRNPETFEIEKEITVTLNGSPVFFINELEYIDGLIYANIWQSNYILIIDSDSGKVRGLIDCSELMAKARELGPTDVLNGIAYDPGKKRIFVTGKYWPYLFEIKKPDLIPEKE